MNKKIIWHKVVKITLEAFIYSSFVIGLIIWYLPEGYINENKYDSFARRWDGTCTGWSKYESTKHIIGGLFHWYAYILAAVVMARLHPVVSTVRSAKIALVLIVLFFIGCGGSHLYDVTTIFYPAYNYSGWFLIINGIISYLGAVFIAISLIDAFSQVKEKRKKIEKMEQSL